MNDSPHNRRVLRGSTAARAAFTLTELLIVVTIIAILASLITAAAVNAMRRAKEARITMEINQISQTLETFKNDFGLYPPNGMTSDTNSLAVSDFRRMFKKAFPRHQEPPRLIDALCGGISQNLNEPDQLTDGMTPAEALYFWLGGFSSDPKYPISGSGGPSFLASNGEVLEDRARIYDFDLTRLGPRTDDGQFDQSRGRHIIYNDPRDNSLQRRINFWQYSPGGSEQPLVYFDVSRHEPFEYDARASLNDSGSTVSIFALKKIREGISENSYRLQDLVFVQDGKFQVLHSGTDDAWGDWSAMQVPAGSPQDVVPDAKKPTLFPTGPFVGDPADTLTNFTEGTLEASQE